MSSNIDPFVFLSDLIGTTVWGDDHQRLGRLTDMLIEAAPPAYPRVQAIRIRTFRPREMKRIGWEDIADVTGKAIKIRRGVAALRPIEFNSNEIPIVQDVLDRQILDTDGAKVERVNDIHLIWARGELRLAHVDVGFRGLVRRLGWQKVTDGAVRLWKPSAPYLVRENFVAWKYVQPLASGASQLRLDVRRAAIADLHPADLADILEDLDGPERVVLFRQLPVDAAANTLEEASPELQRELLNSVAPERAADMLEAMEPDTAADVLGELPWYESNKLLVAMEASEAKEVKQLLAYHEASAGGIMTLNHLTFRIGLTVGDAIAQFRTQAKDLEHIHEAYVLEADGTVAGMVPLKDLLLTEPTYPLNQIMREHPAHVQAEDSLGEVADLAAKYNLLSLPVQDATGHLLGVVTIDDVLAKVLHG